MRALKITMLGLRGFPGVQGGVERHVEYLAPELAALGCEVEAIVRSRYVRHYPLNDFHGVKLRRVWAPNSKSLETIVHSALGVFVAGARRPHILHIHAIGPSLVAPLARMLGLKVVVTHHGHDYRRHKWGGFARACLRLGELFCAKYAHARIAVSNAIARALKERFSAESTVIPNGTASVARADGKETLQRFGLEPGRYVLMVGRLVPEKRHFDAIAAFRAAGLEGWKLAIVGDGDFGTDYVRAIDDAIASDPSIVRTGFQTGTPLAELYSHAGLFVLPSSHEGMSIALLEALGFGIPVLASDIEANAQFALPTACYFPAGKTEALARHMQRIATDAREATAASLPGFYDWRHIAKQTFDVYSDVANQGHANVRYAHPLVFLLAFLFALIAPRATAQPFQYEGNPPVLHRGVSLHNPERWAGLQPGSTSYVPIPVSDSGYVDGPTLQTIRAAGFDFVRLTTEPGPFLQFQGADRDALDATLLERVQKILGYGLSVIVDFHPPFRNPAYAPAALVGPRSVPLQPLYSQMLTRTARLLAGLHSRGVLLELMNEPATSNTATDFASWQEQQDRYYRAARTGAPTLTLMLTGGYSSEPVGLLALNPAPFANDPNVMFTFHYYFPLEFTAQGSPVQRFAQYLADVPYPARAHPLAETLAATAARIAQSDLPASEKPQEVSRTTATLDAYWASNFNRRTIAADFDRVRAWAHAYRIADNRILVGEFGVTRIIGTYHGAADADRLRWLKDVHEVAEVRHFPWAVWGLYWGAGGMQINENSAMTKLDPVVCAGLALRSCPNGY